MWKRAKQFRLFTHEHRIQLILLGFTAVFDASFGIEKLMEAFGIHLNPWFWAVLYLSLGAVTSLVAWWDWWYDTRTDCKEK